MDHRDHNIRQIEMLSQRGETLSIVDLISAHTLSVDMAAHLLCMMASRASFLTAARPGNAGKTTLMACILMFLPPDTRIVTVADASIIPDPSAGRINEKACYLCHEIGNGPWYGYLWGRDVGRYLSLMRQHQHIASCMHADTLGEMEGILISEELGVRREDFQELDFILFMHLGRRDWDYTRRVSAFYEAGERGDLEEPYRLLFAWDEGDDAFHQRGESLLLRKMARENGITQQQMGQLLSRCEDHIRRLVEKQVTDYRSVCRETWRFYEDAMGIR